MFGSLFKRKKEETAPEPHGPDKSSCRICLSASPVFFDGDRAFYHCPVCGLVFANSRGAAPKGIEAESLAHDAEKLFTAASSLISPENILIVSPLDPGWRPEGDVSECRAATSDELTDLVEADPPVGFDLIIALEFAEEQLSFWKGIGLLNSLLRPGGVVAFNAWLTDGMVEVPNGSQLFGGWPRKNIPSKVNFFSSKTVSRAASMRAFTPHMPEGENRLFLFRKEG